MAGAHAAISWNGSGLKGCAVMKRFCTLVMVVAGLALPALALAHAHPERYAPEMGATVAAAPAQVKIWFNADIEPLFDELTVKDAKGQPVTVGKPVVHAAGPATLEVALDPALPPGTYRVHWQVAARDGHHSQGDYVFTVAPPK